MGSLPFLKPMIDNRVRPSVHRPSRDFQVPVPSGPRCSNSLSAVSRRSVERPFLVIAANIPPMRSVLQGVGAPLEGTTDILCHHHDHSPEYCCGALVLFQTQDLAHWQAPPATPSSRQRL